MAGKIVYLGIPSTDPEGLSMKILSYVFLGTALWFSGFSSSSLAQDDFPTNEPGQKDDIEQNVNDMVKLMEELQNDEEMSSELFLPKEGMDTAESQDPTGYFMQTTETLNPTRNPAEKNNAEDSIETANEVVRLDPDNAKNHFQLGLEYWLSKNLDGAIHQFQEVVRMAPGNAHAFWNLGLLYDEKNQGPEAIANIKKAESIYAKYNYSTYVEEARKRLRSYSEKYGNPQ